MHVLLSIAAAVRERVRASHGDVISRVLDELESRITAAEEKAKTCSYGAVLGDYTWLKVSIHHSKRKLNDGLDMREAFARLQEADRRVRALRHRMYSHVCMECAACLSRRKPWPGSAVFAPAGMNQRGDVFIFRHENEFGNLPGDDKTFEDCKARFPGNGFIGHPVTP